MRLEVARPQRTGALQAVAPADDAVEVIGATQGLATAARGLAAAQADFARASGASVTDPVHVVDAKLAEARIRATAAVVHTMDDMLGTLVDTLA